MPDDFHRRYLRKMRSRWGFLIVCLVMMVFFLLVFRGEVIGTFGP